MSSVDTTAANQTDAISFELELKHAPQKVWRALTDPTLLQAWLLPAIGFVPEKGRAFTLQAPSFPNWDGKVACTVVESEPMKKLSYTWDVGPMNLQTLVTFVLTPTETGTRLYLVQSGFKPEQKQNFGGARYGWKSMSGKLIDALATLL